MLDLTNKKTLTNNTQELTATNIKYIYLFRQKQEALNKDGSGSRLGVALRYNYIKIEYLAHYDVHALLVMAISLQK